MAKPEMSPSSTGPEGISPPLLVSPETRLILMFQEADGGNTARRERGPPARPPASVTRGRTRGRQILNQVGGERERMRLRIG